MKSISFKIKKLYIVKKTVKIDPSHPILQYLISIFYCNLFSYQRPIYLYGMEWVVAYMVFTDSSLLTIIGSLKWEIPEWIGESFPQRNESKRVLTEKWKKKYLAKIFKRKLKLQRKSSPVGRGGGGWSRRSP